MGSGDDKLTDAQRSPLHKNGRDGSAAAIEPRLDDRAFGAALGVGDEIEQLRLQRNRLEQLVEVCLLGRRNLDRQSVAAERFDLNVVLKQFLHHTLRVGFRFVDLVDRDDDWGSGRLGVADRFNRLRHDAVVGRHHQNHDVGHFCAARAHGSEGGVARRINEGDRLARPGQ